mmetsp:Transcript_56622/g.132028  ORF Transcript_56622/g.132028 Transcript_56622/m.132028 type:complete len:500 (-) Transcript_56622:80-1579(-)
MAGNAQATIAALVASMGAFLFGLDIGYIAPILECASFKRDVAHLHNWDDPSSKIHSGIVGFIVGIFSLGCIVTSMPVVSSYFLDTWGRRSSILVGTSFFLTGCVIQALAMSIRVMYLGRVVTGGSIGLLSSVVPLYQAEMASPSMRGALTSLYQLMITAGIFVAAFVDSVLVFRDNGWRYAIWLQTIPAGVILVSMPFLPRSPRWLVQQGRLMEAKSTLYRIREPEEAEQEMAEIVEDFEASKRLGEPRWVEVFTGRVGRLVALGSALQLLQQLVGMNAFMYFGPRIFGSFGLKENRFQTINNAVNFVSTLPALYLADRSGRTILMIVGAAGMTVACTVMGILGTIFMDKHGGHLVLTNSSVGGIMMAMVFGFVVSFACTWGPIVWVYCCEIFPMKYRGRCVGVTTVTNWVGNYIIAQFSPMLLESLGFGTFFIFGGFSLIGLLLSLWLPETKGLLLEHIGPLFDKKFGMEPVNAKDAKSYGGVDNALSRDLKSNAIKA